MSQTLRKVEKMKRQTMNDTKELRSFLIEQMEGIANGEIDESRARGVANVAQQIYNTLNIELKMATTSAKIGDQKIGPVAF